MTDTTGKKCSVVELGQMLNLSPRRLQQLAKEGIIPKEQRGQYDLAGAVRGYLQRRASQESERTTLLEAKIANKVLEVAERRIRLDQMKRILIDRAQAVALVTQLSREGRDSFLNWPARVAAPMAADLGLDAAALQASLDRHVRKNLAELDEIEPDFR